MAGARAFDIGVVVALSEFSWNAVAQGAYEAYAQVVRTDAQTLSVPEWEELPPRMQEGWREAA